MGLRSQLGQLTAVESDLKWSRCKAIYVQGPPFFGCYSIFVDADLNVAFFLPNGDRSLHVFFGNPVAASRWIKFSPDGNVTLDKLVGPDSFGWEISQSGVLLRGRMLPPNNPVYKSDVLAHEFFGEEITAAWLREHAHEALKSME